jgi:hypothetical protein
VILENVQANKQVASRSFHSRIQPNSVRSDTSLRQKNPKRQILAFDFDECWPFATVGATAQLAEIKRMDTNLIILFLLTFVIHLIGTLSYAVRIAGVRTRRVAMSFSLFNILVLVSRTSNSFQGPFLAKRIESNLLQAVEHSLLGDFRWLLLSATLATVAGAFLIPTFQRIFSKAVQSFQMHRSVPRLLLHACLNAGSSELKSVVAMPSPATFGKLRAGASISVGTIVLNILAVALWTVGVFAALYAGYLNPQLRVTSSMLSSVVNGVATILMFVIIDPQVSVMTDDVIEGKVSEPSFRRAIVWLVGSRFAGTLLAQILLVPAATFIIFVAKAL